MSIIENGPSHARMAYFATHNVTFDDLGSGGGVSPRLDPRTPAVRQPVPDFTFGLAEHEFFPGEYERPHFSLQAAAWGVEDRARVKQYAVDVASSCSLARLANSPRPMMPFARATKLLTSPATRSSHSFDAPCSSRTSISVGLRPDCHLRAPEFRGLLLLEEACAETCV